VPLRPLGNLLFSTFFRPGARPLLGTRRLALGALPLPLPLPWTLTLTRPLRSPTRLGRRTLAPTRFSLRPLSPPRLALRLRKTISWCGLNFKFNEFIPLRIGPVTLGDGKEFTEPLTRINMDGFIHVVIMRHTGKELKFLARLNILKQEEHWQEIMENHDWPAPQAARRKRSPTAAQAGFCGISSTTIISTPALSSSRNAA
jgi:hypothetical protein